jgi:hypothetical protein
MFLLFFALLPIKSLFQFLLSNKRDICVEEENFDERRYSQLYRPGDKRFKQIIKLESKAKKLMVNGEL